MREISFRGKRLDNGEWVDGNLFIDEKEDKHEILIGYANYRVSWEVAPETVGEFTGLIDKNGKKIFEGDIVKSYDIFGRVDGCGVVHWSNTFCSWHFGKYKSMYSEHIATYEVIDNIHDNPEQQAEVE